jgi:nucleotide-binding universal stress UspA family protein
VVDTKALNRIVVGVDGSPQARNALRWAARLAPLLGAEITVVHGTGLLDDLGGAVVPAHARLDLIRTTVERDWCRVLGHPRHPIHIEVRERPAVDAITAAVDELDPRLVLVGTRGAGLARAQAIGSTALQVLQQLAPRAVPALVVPEPADSPSVDLRRLLVGVDGSAASLAALAWAQDLAVLTGASCEVLAAVEDDPVFPLGPSATVTADGETGAPRRVRALVGHWCQSLRDADVPHRVTVVRGSAAPTLVRAARTLAPDLVVIGSSGAGSAGDPLVGSVSRRVAHDAGRPVAVVPAYARLRHPAPVPTLSGAATS